MDLPGGPPVAATSAPPEDASHLAVPTALLTDVVNVLLSLPARDVLHLLDGLRSQARPVSPDG